MTEPTRFLHTPGIGTTTYLITDTPEGRALADATPEDSTRLRVQRRMARATKPLALLMLITMALVAGDQLLVSHIAAGPILGTWGYVLVAVVAVISFGCYVLSTQGHDSQEHLLHSSRDIAQPLRYSRGDLTRLPMTIRGLPTLVVLSRAADAGAMGAVYAEMAHPGRVHSSEIEAALDEVTRP